MPSDASPNYDDRISRLEVELERVRELADRAAEREARIGLPRQPRLAITCAQSSEGFPSAPSYPDPGANTVWIKFLDSTFTETEGEQTPTDTERQATDGAVLAHGRGCNHLQEGLVVHVYHDNGRWWIIPPRRGMVRFEMTEVLALPQSGSGSANAYLLDWVAGDPLDNLTAREDTILVVDGMRMFSKMATESPDVGAYGIAWTPDDPMLDSPYSATWEILTMQTPGMFTGSLDSALTTSTSSVVVTAFRTDKAAGHITHEGYDPFGAGWSDANGGLKITVYNPPGGGVPYIFEGDSGGTVLCRWNMRESRYYIIQAECPLDAEESFLLSQFFNE